MKRVLLSAAALLAGAAAHAQFSVTAENNGTTLANALVGTGTNIQNVMLNCGSSGSGLFNGGLSTNLGLGSGVVLSTGQVNGSMMNIASPAGNTAAYVFNTPGDPALDSIVNTTTYDGCVLEFDVTVAGTYLMLNYVFASEEYPEYACTAFNDVFSFQLSGPNPSGPDYQNYNIARIPGTTTPVSINSVNGQACDSSGGAYFVDNAASTQIVFDGFTTPMIATAETTPGGTYHMRFAIADVADGVMDSGVFLAGGSLKSANSTSVAQSSSTGLSTLQPNPATGSTTLTNQTMQLLDYTVVSMMGQTLRKGTVGAGSSAAIDLSGLTAGSYLVRSASGAVVTTQRVEVR